MPALDLYAKPLRVRDLSADGNLVLDPPLPGLPRVLLRRLTCLLRVPTVPGAREAVLDTGAPLTVFPFDVWSREYRWQAGRDYDPLSVAGVAGVLHGQVLQHRYQCRLARLRVPVELAGRSLNVRLRLDSLVVQLTEPGGPPYIILGLWGNALDGRTIQIARHPGSDELAAHLRF